MGLPIQFSFSRTFESIKDNAGTLAIGGAAAAVTLAAGYAPAALQPDFLHHTGNIVLPLLFAPSAGLAAMGMKKMQDLKGVGETPYALALVGTAIGLGGTILGAGAQVLYNLL